MRKPQVSFTVTVRLAKPVEWVPGVWIQGWTHSCMEFQVPNLTVVKIYGTLISTDSRHLRIYLIRLHAVYEYVLLFEDKNDHLELPGGLKCTWVLCLFWLLRLFLPFFSFHFDYLSISSA